MVKFLNAIIPNKNNNKNKPKIQGKPSLIEELNSFLVLIEVENLRLINEEMYNELSFKATRLKEELERNFNDSKVTQDIILNYIEEVYSVYYAYKMTLEFKNKSDEIRKNIIENECKKVIDKSKNGSSLEELLKHLEEIKEINRLNSNIKEDERLLEIIKQTSYLLHKNFYLTSRNNDRSLSNEELLKFKNYIILDGSKLLNDSLKVQVIFAFKDLNNPSGLRELYDELIQQEIKENSEETKIELTLFPKNIEVNTEELNSGIETITESIKELMFLDEDKYKEFLQLLAILKAKHLNNESGLEVKSLLKDLESKYNNYISLRNMKVHAALIKHVLESSKNISSYSDFTSFMEDVNTNREVLKIEEVAKVIRKIEYRFLKEELNNIDITRFVDEIIEDLEVEPTDAEITKIRAMNERELKSLYLTKTKSKCEEKFCEFFTELLGEDNLPNLEGEPIILKGFYGSDNKYPEGQCDLEVQPTVPSFVFSMLSCNTHEEFIDYSVYNLYKILDLRKTPGPILFLNFSYLVGDKYIPGPKVLSKYEKRFLEERNMIRRLNITEDIYILKQKEMFDKFKYLFGEYTEKNGELLAKSLFKNVFLENNVSAKYSISAKYLNYDDCYNEYSLYFKYYTNAEKAKTLYEEALSKENNKDNEIYREEKVVLLKKNKKPRKSAQ